MEQMPNYYAVIPANVRYSKEICPNAKLLYGEITALSNSLGYCYAGNRYFAELYNISRLQTITDWVKSLERAGFITVELTYKGKEIDKRIIKIAHPIPTTENSDTYNAKTFEVQLKNVVGTTEKRCVNNTSNREEDKSSSPNNLAHEEKKEVVFFYSDADYAEFDAECKARGFEEIAKRVKFTFDPNKPDVAGAKTPSRLTAENLKEKIQIYGEVVFWQIIGKIDNYLKQKKDVKYSSLDSVIRKWFGGHDAYIAQCEFIAFWHKKHQYEYKPFNEFLKWEFDALRGIAAKVRKAHAEKQNKKQSEVSSEDLRNSLKLFFEKIPQKWVTVEWFKLSTIESDFAKIMAIIKDPKLAKNFSSGGNIETFKERDKRLQQQERENRDAKMRAAALYEVQKEQIERFLDNGYTITEEMKQYPAYKEMFGEQGFGGQDFGSGEAF